MTTRRTGKLYYTCISASTLALGVANAQSPVTSAGAADASASSGGLEEIVVTALRREETTFKTPAAITALSSQDLERADVTDAVKMQYLAPSLMVTQTGQGIYISIRGVTTTDQTSKGEPGIQFNTDGIPVSRAEEQALAFFDLARVEVLAGPQGTLYGKSSTGGAINVITNAPTQQTEASAKVTFGNYAQKRIEGMVNLPLSDMLAVRIAGAATSRDGYINLLGGGAQNTGSDRPGDDKNMVGRISALARFSDTMQLRLTATLGRIDEVGYGSSGQYSVDADSNNRVTGTTVGAWNPFPGFIRDNFAKENAQFDAALGPVHLTYVGSNSRYHTTVSSDDYLFGAQGSDAGNNFPSGVAADGSRGHDKGIYETTYQELRFSNADESRLQWISGVNYWYEHVQEDGGQWQMANSLPTGPNLGPNGLLPIYLANGWDPNYQNIVELINHTNHKSMSVFAHGVYSLTDLWHLTLGVRESYDKIVRIGGTIAPGPFQFGTETPWPSSSGGLCVNGAPCIGPINNSGHGDSTKFVWNVGSDYQFTPSTLGYLTIATGYKPGGFNDQDPHTNPIGQFAPYAPEKMLAYELGVKMHSSVGVDFTSAFYYYDYQSEQIQSTYNFGPGLNFLFTIGTPTKLYGLENSLKWAITRNDILSFDADFEKSRYEDFRYTSSRSIAVDLTGTALDRTPSAVLTAGFSHIWDLPNGGAVQLHGRSRWSSSYNITNFDYGIQYEQKPFSRSDADLTYTFPSSKAELQFFVTNIENKVQVTGDASPYPAGVQFPPGYSATAFGQVSQPRFWGVSVSVKY